MLRHELINRFIINDVDQMLHFDEEWNIIVNQRRLINFVTINVKIIFRWFRPKKQNAIIPVVRFNHISIKGTFSSLPSSIKTPLFMPGSLVLIFEVRATFCWCPRWAILIRVMFTNHSQNIKYPWLLRKRLERSCLRWNGSKFLFQLISLFLRY